MSLQDPVPESGDASTAQAGGAAASGNPRSGPGGAGVLDFSSASEDEGPCSSRSKAPEPGDESRTSAGCANLGLSALLQNHAAHRGALRSSGSSEESEPEKTWQNPEEPGAQAAWALSSDSEEEREAAPGRSSRSPTKKNLDPTDHADPQVHMEESEDLVIFQRPLTKAQQGRRQAGGEETFALRRREEDIESFSSSEEEVSVRKVKSKTERQRGSPQKTVGFTGLKSPTPRRPHTNTGTIDTLLGTFS